MTPLSTDQLKLAPELAVLVLLETAADSAILSLAALYPEVQDLDACNDSPTLLLALEIIESARAVAASVHHYKIALHLAHKPGDLLSF